MTSLSKIHVTSETILFSRGRILEEQEITTDAGPTRWRRMLQVASVMTRIACWTRTVTNSCKKCAVYIKLSPTHVQNSDPDQWLSTYPYQRSDLTLWLHPSRTNFKQRKSLHTIFQMILSFLKTMTLSFIVSPRILRISLFSLFGKPAILENIFIDFNRYRYLDAWQDCRMHN